mgnify:CR=1 FL=1
MNSTLKEIMKYKLQLFKSVRQQMNGIYDKMDFEGYDEKDAKKKKSGFITDVMNWFARNLEKDCLKAARKEDINLDELRNLNFAVNDAEETLTASKNNIKNLRTLFPNARRKTEKTSLLITLLVNVLLGGITRI